MCKLKTWKFTFISSIKNSPQLLKLFNFYTSVSELEKSNNRENIRIIKIGLTIFLVQWKFYASNDPRFRMKPSFFSSNNSIKRDYQKRDDKRDEDRRVHRQLSRSSFERVRSRLASAIPAIVITLPDNLELLITRDTYRAAISSPVLPLVFGQYWSRAHVSCYSNLRAWTVSKCER